MDLHIYADGDSVTLRRSWLSVALYFTAAAAVTTFAGYVRSGSRSGMLVPFALGLLFLGLKSLWDIRVPYIVATTEQLQVNPQGKPAVAVLWSDVLCTYLVDGDKLAIMQHDESVEWVSLGPLLARDRQRLIGQLEELGLLSNRPSGRGVPQPENPGGSHVQRRYRADGQKVD